MALILLLRRTTATAMIGFSAALASASASAARPDLPQSRSVVVAGSSIHRFFPDSAEANAVTHGSVPIRGDGLAEEALRLRVEEGRSCREWGTIVDVQAPFEEGDVLSTTPETRSIGAFDIRALVCEHRVP